MKTSGLRLNDWLCEQLKSPRFRKAYEEEDIKARLALRIAEIRRRKGISQSHLARKLHTTQQVISDIETFKHPNLTLLTLQRIAEALGSRLVVDIQ